MPFDSYYAAAEPTPGLAVAAWRPNLARNSRGQIRRSIGNILAVLESVPAWHCLAIDDRVKPGSRSDRLGGLAFVAPPPWHPAGARFAPREFRNSDCFQVQRWLAHLGVDAAWRTIRSALWFYAEGQPRFPAERLDFFEHRLDRLHFEAWLSAQPRVLS